MTPETERQTGSVQKGKCDCTLRCEREDPTVKPFSMSMGCDQWEHCQTPPLVTRLWATLSPVLSFSTSKLVLVENRRVFLPFRHIDSGETGRIYSHIQFPSSPELNAWTTTYLSSWRTLINDNTRQKSCRIQSSCTWWRIWMKPHESDIQKHMNQTHNPFPGRSKASSSE